MPGFLADQTLITDMGHEPIGDLVGHERRLMTAGDRNGLEFETGTVLSAGEAELQEVKLVRGGHKATLQCASDQELIVTSGGRLESEWQRVRASELESGMRLVSTGSQFWEVADVHPNGSSGRVFRVDTERRNYVLSVGLIAST